MACKNVLEESGPMEDTLFYWLFPFNSDWTPVTNEFQLKSLISEYMAHLFLDVKDYIWSSEQFSLSVSSDSGEDSLPSRPHIRGKMVVEGFLEDEWFVFYLLSKLTKLYPTLICRVYDQDGEFPLIEAAENLPLWANDPRSTEGRVFIRDGRLHLVPPSVLPIVSCDTFHTTNPEITMTALGHVVQTPTATLASPAIQNAISLKIEEYPRKISKEHHSTHAFVPVGVAALLQEYPTLVSAAVRAFCDRDTLDNKCLRVMKHFPPETRVMTSVRFSKALYARLSSNPYIPDRRTGWNIPPKENGAHNSHMIGMKLACGFEILVCSAGGIIPSASSPTEGEDTMEQTLCNNPLWIKYKESLMKKGYFRGQMEGSKLFCELETNARKFFVSNQLLTPRKGNAVDEHLSIGSIIVKLMSKVDADYEAFKKKENIMSPPDDEKWLQIDPDEFDQMLESKFKTNEDKMKMQGKLYEELNAFLSHSSSFEGAEIPEELRPKPTLNNNQNFGEEKCRRSTLTDCNRKISSGNMRKISNRTHHPQFRKISNHSNASDSSEISSFSAKIDFNAEAFTDALNNITEYSLPEDEYFNGTEGGSSGMSSYEDDDENEVTLNSRKTSNESKVSSGIEVDVASSSEPPPQRPPRRKKKSSERKIPLAAFEDFDADDSDDECQPVVDLIKAFKEECGIGPTTSLFASLAVNEIKK